MIARFIFGENMVQRWWFGFAISAVDTLKSAKSCAFAAKLWCDYGGWWCGCGVFVFGFFMIVWLMGRSEICKFQFL